jgi:hypothetical protein
MKQKIGYKFLIFGDNDTVLGYLRFCSRFKVTICDLERRTSSASAKANQSKNPRGIVLHCASPPG